MKKKIFLDECIDHRFARDFSDKYEIRTSRSMGWNNRKIGDKPLLARLAKSEVDVLLTVDQNIKYEQNLSKQNVQVVCLRSHNNKRQTLKQHIPRIEAEISQLGRSERYKEIDLRPRRNKSKEKDLPKEVKTLPKSPTAEKRHRVRKRRQEMATKKDKNIEAQESTNQKRQRVRKKRKKTVKRRDILKGGEQTLSKENKSSKRRRVKSRRKAMSVSQSTETHKSKTRAKAKSPSKGKGGKGKGPVME